MKQFLGFEVEVPFGPAAGAINGPSIEIVEKQAREALMSPVGAVWIGSITMQASEGNAHYGRTYYHNPRTGQTVNSMGLPNIGIDAAESITHDLAQIAADHGKPLIVSVSPAKGEDPSVVLPVLAHRALRAGAHGVEVNYSCPNKVTEDGGREPILGYDPEMVEETRDAIVRSIGEDQNLIEKMPPYTGDRAGLLPVIARGVMTSAGVRYVAVMNTVPGQSLLDEDGRPALDVSGNLGGMSGPAVAETAMGQLREWCEHLPSNIGIISCGGLMSGADVLSRTNLIGADFAAGVTLYFENEQRRISYGKTGVKIAEEYAEAAAEVSGS